MTGTSSGLSVLDTDSGDWARHPWPEVHARAENVAERISDDHAAVVGLVGDPTVEFIAAIPGSSLRVRPCRSCRGRSNVPIPTSGR